MALKVKSKVSIKEHAHRVHKFQFPKIKCFSADSVDH